MKTFVPELSIEEAPTVEIKSGKDYKLIKTRFGQLASVRAPRLTERLVHQMVSDDVECVALNSLFQEGAIAFDLLSKIPKLKHLRVSTGFKQNWQHLLLLSRLNSLRIDTQGKSPESLDFRRFKELQLCEMTWHREWTSILEHENLCHLNIHQRQGKADLDLSKLINLREIFLTQCVGLKRVLLPVGSKVVSMQIAGCYSFNLVSPHAAFKNLKYFRIFGKSRLNYSEIAELVELRRFWLESVGRIESLHFVKPCRNLVFLDFGGNTIVRDGDLGFLKELPLLKTIQFNRAIKHYSITAT